MKRFVAVAAVVFLSGCSEGQPSMGTRINVWHDDQRAVTCWVVTERAAAGVAVSCLPDAALTKKAEVSHD